MTVLLLLLLAVTASRKERVWLSKRLFPKAEAEVKSPLIVHIFPGILDPLSVL
jgi:hypothetical protein